MTSAERILAAARDGDAAAVRELLARDPALVGAVDVHRKTPLHLAAAHDHPEVAELLFEASADLEAWTGWGRHPARVGRRARQPPECVELLAAATKPPGPGR
jgi:ankyrin repeat protein